MAATPCTNSVSPTGAIATDQIAFFDVGAKKWSLAPESSDFAARGAHSGLTLQSGAVVLVGGESNFDALIGAPQRAFVEVYAPSHLDPAK